MKPNVLRTFSLKSIDPLMAFSSPSGVLLLLCNLVLIFWAKGQDCDSPALLCAQVTPLDGGNQSGIPSQAPASFCFSDMANVVFYTFQTLDLVSFPSLAFPDGSASISLGNVLCDNDPLLGQGLSIAVFTASDLCDINSFDPPVYCNPVILSDELISLSNLLPSTTYYIAVSGLFGSPPAVDPSLCTYNLVLSGPAVTYDLDANWYAQNNENRIPQILFDGETLVLTADQVFPDLTWTGTALNSTDGAEVTANPEGIDNSFTYVVETTINGCPVSDQVTVIIRPAVVAYNAFTPNGDGINDTWEIANIAQWPDAQIRVYSRWGQRVFQTTNYSNNWGGDDLPAATYYYVIELNPIGFNSDPYTGAVTIMR